MLELKKYDNQANKQHFNKNFFETLCSVYSALPLCYSY